MTPRARLSKRATTALSALGTIPKNWEDVGRVLRIPNTGRTTSEELVALALIEGQTVSDFPHYRPYEWRRIWYFKARLEGLVK